VDEWKDGWMVYRWIYGQMYGWMSGWTDEWMSGWMDVLDASHASAKKYSSYHTVHTSSTLCKRIGY
jgi:hypothetical protein